MRIAVRRLALAPALSALDVFLPVQAAWWALFGVPLLAALHWGVGFLAAFPITLAIGPFGLAIIAMTLLVRLVLLPLAAYQVRVSLRARREAVALQARLAPAVARLRRRYRGRPMEFQRALLELKRREGIDPLAGAGGALKAGLLPWLVQLPLLIALYQVILTFAHSGHDLHFLWIANLALPDPVLLPVLAGLATFLLTRLTNAARPPSLGDDEQTAATNRTLALVSPVGLVLAAHFAPAALALYWLTGSLVGAAQQWVVNRFVLSRAAATS
jgi:YidC/Oxa1 family membrane protein insertase